MSTNESLKSATDLATKGMEHFNAMAELNMRTWEKLASRQKDVYNLCVEQGMRMAKLATESKDYGDYVRGHVEIVRDVTERMMAQTKQNMELVGEVGDEYRTWYERGLSELSGDLRDAVTPVDKA